MAGAAHCSPLQAEGWVGGLADGENSTDLQTQPLQIV